MSRDQKDEHRVKSEEKIQRFTDLIAWQKAHELVLAIYKAVEKFPKQERFGLTSQITRAAVSISSNIAEGFSRDSYADKKHFYVMSHGSLTELQNQLLIAKDIKYLSTNEFNNLAELSIETVKPLVGLIKSTKERI